MADHQIGAVVLIEDMMLNANANAIADLAIMKRLPSSGFPEFVRDGCLIAYGINFPDMDYRAAAFHIINSSTVFAPGGSVSHGCFEEVKMWMSGGSRSCSSSVPTRTKRTAGPVWELTANCGRAGGHSMMKKLLLLALIAVAREATAEDAKCVREHAAMVETIRAYAQSNAGLLGPQGISESVLEAMGQTERHRFVPGRSCSVAYADRPVFIGQDQTISQPFIVALMTHLAEVNSDHTVLEVGTGSGYQAAILARLVRKVCTVEIIPPLAEAAAKLLRNLGYDNVSVKVGDGYHGWLECGPFDAMIVTAALEHVPPPLIEQLKVGGRLVMPLGPVHATQQLTVVEKIAPGQTKTHSAILVRFVPFTRSRD